MSDLISSLLNTMTVASEEGKTSHHDATDIKQRLAAWEKECRHETIDAKPHPSDTGAVDESLNKESNRDLNTDHLLTNRDVQSRSYTSNTALHERIKQDDAAALYASSLNRAGRTTGELKALSNTVEMTQASYAQSRHTPSASRSASYSPTPNGSTQGALLEALQALWNKGSHRGAAFEPFNIQITFNSTTNNNAAQPRAKVWIRDFKARYGDEISASMSLIKHELDQQGITLEALFY